MMTPSHFPGAFHPAEAFSAGKYAEVCRHFAAMPPTQAQDWLLLGRTRLALGEPAVALDCLQKGLQSSPGDLALQYHSACALARLSRWGEVVLALPNCINDPNWRERALATRAQARIRAALWADAESDYRELGKLRPLTPGDRLGLAAALVSLNRWPQAEGILKSLVTGEKAHELVWLLRGRCLEGQRQWAEAAAVYQQGLAQYPESQALAVRLLLTARRPAARKPEVLLHTLTSRRQLLMRWTRRQVDLPGDLKLAHRIALLAGSSAQVLQRLRPGRARDLWRQALANWALLATTTSWQETFLAERVTRYGQTLTERDREQFLEALHGHIDKLVELAQGERPPVGEPNLREEFLRETAAAEACRTLLPGGIELPGGGGLVGGPLLLVQLGLTSALSRALPRARQAETPTWLAWSDPEEWHSAAGQLQMLYSTLGFAQARLQTDDPRAALDALRWTICPACAAAFRRSRPHEIAVCRDDCAEFASRNPGFAAPGLGSVKLQAAAEWLRLQAHVAVINLALRVAEPNPAEVVKHWKQALELASGPRCEALLHHLTERLLNRGEELMRTERAGAAVALLEAVSGCHSDPEALAQVLASARTSYGIQLANRGDMEGGASQLRLAFATRPLMPRARTNLVTALGNLAHEAYQRKDLERTGRLLDEAEALCQCEGVLATELADLADGLVPQRMGLLIELAATRYNAGGRDEARGHLERAQGLVMRTWTNVKAREEAEALAEKVKEYMDIVCRRE